VRIIVCSLHGSLRPLRDSRWVRNAVKPGWRMNSNAEQAFLSYMV